MKTWVELFELSGIWTIFISIKAKNLRGTSNIKKAQNVLDGQLGRESTETHLPAFDEKLNQRQTHSFVFFWRISMSKHPTTHHTRTVSHFNVWLWYIELNILADSFSSFTVFHVWPLQFEFDAVCKMHVLKYQLQLRALNNKKSCL